MLFSSEQLFLLLKLLDKEKRGQHATHDNKKPVQGNVLLLIHHGQCYACYVTRFICGGKCILNTGFMLLPDIVKR